MVDVDIKPYLDNELYLFEWRSFSELTPLTAGPVCSTLKAIDKIIVETKKVISLH